MKNKEIEKFIKLSKEEKSNLTLKWLANLVKSEDLTIYDVMDIINSVETSFSKLDKFNSLLIGGEITPTLISRMFGFGYAKSMEVINSLLKEHAIIKLEIAYKIVDKEKFKFVGEKIFNKGGKNE